MEATAIFAADGDVALGRSAVAGHAGHEEASGAAEPDDPFAVDADPRPLPVPVAGEGLLVLHAGEAAGAVSWMPVLHGPSYPCTAWMIGVHILPPFRGRGLGAASQRLLARYLFAMTELDRIEAETDVDNTPERRALLRAGFTEEGVARGAQLRDGKRRDLARYAVLRGELPALESE